MGATLEDIRSLTFERLSDDFCGMGLPAFRARQVFAWLHARKADSFEEMTDIKKELRQRLSERYCISTLRIEKQLASKLDETRKFLFGLPDKNRVEAVWMEYRHGNTVCISTQVGCRMGCRFCASTLGGLVRGLTAGEMLGEVYALEKAAESRGGGKIGGVVLMGIGEPLDNFDAVTDFLRILSSPMGMNLSLRHVSLSTCGLVPEIDRLAELSFPLTLSVSLHAPDDETRSRLMPVNRRYPVGDLLAACKRYFERTGRRISFEYALAAGQNDTPEAARRLCAALRATGMPCHVNLIPVNEVPERDCRRSSRQSVEAFRALLERGGVNATIRRELGSDINAACGQLRREEAGKGGAEGA